MAEANGAAVRLRLTTLINGIPFETVQFMSTFELNSIPTASSVVAVGRDITSGMRVAAIHRQLALIERGAPYEVILTMKPLWTSGTAPNDWGPMSFRVFDGYVNGTGYQRTNESVNFIIHAEHWLSDLNASSALSQASHPGNPSDFTFPAGFIGLNSTQGTKSGAGGKTNATSWTPHIKRDLFDKAKLEQDLWTNVLKEMMLWVTNQEPIDERLKTCAGGNAAALESINRIVSDKMGMDLPAGDGAVISAAVAQALMRTFSVNDANTTLWGKLVGEWIPAYWFSIVPRVEDAIIVPFVGALRGDPWVEILASDYTQAELSNQMAQRLGAVGIMHPTEFLAGANMVAGDVARSRRGLAAVYPVECGENGPAPQTGLILLKDAPPWLSEPLQAYRYGSKATGGSPRRPVQTALTIGGVGEAAVDAAEIEQAQSDFKTILQQYAQHWYVLETVGGRIGELSGRLRFDISPGSIVKLNVGSDKFITEDNLGRSYFASTTRVTTLINSQQQRAGTSLTLAHVRTETENTKDNTSVEKPPLYKEGWYGAPLIDGFTPGK